MSWTLKAAKPQLSIATSADSIALAFAKDLEGVVSFSAPGNLVQDIEKFSFNLLMTLSIFISPARQRP
jgi:leucyl aminopeptidase